MKMGFGKKISHIVGNGNAFLRCGCWKYERFCQAAENIMTSVKTVKLKA